jgi:aspartate/tyrosine/aromatic aminotransferase
MPEGSILLLHACAHNPTGIYIMNYSMLGCDLTNDQWR